MNYRLIRLLVAAVLLIAAVAAIGSYTYQLGRARGIVESGRIAAPSGAPVALAYWPRPWGYGFGFFPVFPLLFFLFFWVFVMRALFWSGRWHRGYRGGWGSHGVPPMFEEWHRRAHDQQPPSPTRS